jgi:hypothetical protein
VGGGEGIGGASKNRDTFRVRSGINAPLECTTDVKRGGSAVRHRSCDSKFGCVTMKINPEANRLASRLPHVSIENVDNKT